MRRRNIQIDGKFLTTRFDEQRRIKETLKEKFLEGEALDKFVEALVRSGWTMFDIESFVKQSSNEDRAPVEAFMFHNEHVLDQVLLNQGTYTHFADTARDPNYALRHPGQTELIMRRLTPGDLLMLQAAQFYSAVRMENDRPAAELDDYWEAIYRTIFQNITSRSPERVGVSNPYTALGYSLGFVLSTLDADGEVCTLYDLTTTFFNPEGRFYVGLVLRYETVRVGNEFLGIYVIARNDNGRESLFMAATVLLCYGIDNSARSVMQGYERFVGTHQFADNYVNLLSRPPLSVVELAESESFTADDNNGNQATVNSTNYFTNRLLP